MKNIIEEASSIVKAIEKGWEKAGKPEAFSVKIYEYPQKNFIGLTTRSAKIGIFFDEKKVEIERKAPAAKPERKTEPTGPMIKKSERLPHKTIDKSEKLPPAKKIVTPPQPQKEQPKEDRIFWTDQMITLSKQWLSDTFEAIQIRNLTFATEVSKHQLTITFNKLILTDKDKERIFLRNLSILLLQTLRHKFKRPLRGFKVNLITRQ